MQQMIALIDLGSNSARLVFYKQDPQGFLYEFDNVRQVLRLSSHLTAEGLLDDEGVQKTLTCMRRFQQLCAARGVKEVTGVATAAVRLARNGPELIREIREQTGLQVRILSGEEEARYGYLAVVNSLPYSDAITVDIGGGSTEVTWIENRLCREKISFPFGAVTLCERFSCGDPVTEEERQRLQAYLFEQFARAPWIRNKNLPVIVMGGSARNLANVHQKKHKYPFDSIHNYSLTAGDVREVYDSLATTPFAKRKKVKGLSKERADLIVAALAVFDALLKTTGSGTLVTSTKGLRDGLVFERVLQGMGRELLEDIPLYSARRMMSRYQVDRPHAEHVCVLALSLYDQMWDKGLLDGSREDRKLLQVAALLHDVGLAINTYEVRQHTFYLLTNVLLLGLTHRERVLVAMVAAYKNDKKLEKQVERYGVLLREGDVRNVKRMALLLWMARTLDVSMAQSVKQVQVQPRENGGGYRLWFVGMEPGVLELELLQELQEPFSQAFREPVSLDLPSGGVRR